MPGEFSSPEQMKETLGGPVRPAARGTAGAHIAKLIKTMLEKKASGIEISNRREIVGADAHIGPLPRPCAIRRAGVGTRPYKTTEVIL